MRDSAVPRPLPLSPPSPEPSIPPRASFPNLARSSSWAPVSRASVSREKHTRVRGVSGQGRLGQFQTDLPLPSRVRGRGRSYSCVIINASMQVGRHKRQVLLFVTAILLPTAVLPGLGARMIRQERELAGKRATDERREALLHLRRELTASLEAIKLQEINRLMRSPGGHWTPAPESPAVVLVSKIEGD